MESVNPNILEVARLGGHELAILDLSWEPNGRRLASASYDGTLRIWERDRPEELPEIVDLGTRAYSVSWSPSGRWLAAGMQDGKVAVIDTNDWAIRNEQKPDAGPVYTVHWSPDGRSLASGSRDRNLFILTWTPSSASFRDTRRIELADHVLEVAWSRRGGMLAAATKDGDITLVNAESRRPLCRLSGHYGPVTSVDWTPDDRELVSASADATVRIWNVRDRRTTRRFDLHKGIVSCVRVSPDGELLASQGIDDKIYISRVEDLKAVAEIQETVLRDFGYVSHALAFCPRGEELGSANYSPNDNEVVIRRLSASELKKDPAVLPTVQYRNAKVILVGDSGVGKSGLALALSGRGYAPTESTHARHVWMMNHLDLSVEEELGSETEILLWDLAGQPGYRLVHQLSLNDVTVAVVVFDAKLAIAPLSGVRYWSRALAHAHRDDSDEQRMIRFLVAARGDRTGVSVSLSRIRQLESKLEFEHYFETSARLGEGVEELRRAILDAVESSSLPYVTTTQVFLRIRRFILQQIAEGRYVSSVDELMSAYQEQEESAGESSDFHACLSLMEAQGIVRKLNIDDQVLLQPEVLDAYASALVNAALAEPEGLGEIAAEDAYQGRFEMPADARILPVRLCESADDIARFIERRAEEDVLASRRQRAERRSPAPSVKTEAGDRSERQVVEDIAGLRQDERLWIADSLIGKLEELDEGRRRVVERHLLQHSISERDLERIKRLRQLSDQEKLIRSATVQELVDHDLALLEEIDGSETLVFPSQYTRELPDAPDPAGKAVILEFEGPVLSIYTRLVVSLSRIDRYGRVGMWKNAVKFQLRDEGCAGIWLRDIDDGAGELTVFFEGGSAPSEMSLFQQYVTEFVRRMVPRDKFSLRRVLTCPNCTTPFSDIQIQRRTDFGFDEIDCSVCGTTVPIADRAEDPMLEELEALAHQSDIARRRVSARLILEGKVETGRFDLVICSNANTLAEAIRISEELSQRGVRAFPLPDPTDANLRWAKSVESHASSIRSVAVLVSGLGKPPWEEDETSHLLESLARRGLEMIPVRLESAKRLPRDLPDYMQSRAWVSFRGDYEEAVEELAWAATGVRP